MVYSADPRTLALKQIATLAGIDALDPIQVAYEVLRVPAQQNDKPEVALAHLSNELGLIFDNVVTSIGAIRSSAGEFASSVGVLQGLGGSDSDHADTGEYASFSVFARRAEHAAAAAEAAAGELDDTTFQTSLNSLSAVLRELKRNIVELAAISSLTKIAKTESPELADRLSVFTETLDMRFSSLRASSSEAAQMIDAIRTESRDARTALSAIAGELHGMSQTAGADGAELDSLRHAFLADVDRMVEESRVLGTQVQSGVSRVIACLQFPDAFAQRMEHLLAILAAADATDDAGRKSVLTHVGLAQLDAMVAALLDAIMTGMTALEAIPLPHDMADGVHGIEGHDASLAWIEAERRADQMMIKAVAASQNRLDAAVSLISRVVSAVDRVRDMLEDSRRQNLELNFSVYNASIVASRHSGGASALHVLADGVKSVVAKISREVSQIIADLVPIRRASEALQNSPLSAELAHLARIQGLAAQKVNEDTFKLARAQEAREHLQASITKLAAAAREARGRFGAAQGYAAPLREIAKCIRDSQITAAAPVAIDLAWVEDLYTMNEERDVHHAAVDALGLISASAQPRTQPVPEVNEEGLDDFLL